MPDKEKYGGSYKDYPPKKSWAEKRADRKERNIYNESLRRAQEAQQQGHTPGKYLKGQIAEHGWSDPSSERFRGSGKGNLGQKFKAAWMHGADLFAQGLGSFSEAEKARVGGKFNAPLNVQYGTPAYKWLLNTVITDDDDKDDFRKEVGKGNLSWTELNKYADDEYIGGGQLARGINARNEGIIGSGAGAEALADAYRAQADENGDGAIGNALANYNLKINSMNLPDTMSDENKMYYAANPEKYYASHPFSMRTEQKAPVIYSDLMATADPWVATQQAAMAGMEDIPEDYGEIGLPLVLPPGLIVGAEELDRLAAGSSSDFIMDQEGDWYHGTGNQGGIRFDPGYQALWQDETGTWHPRPKLEHPSSRSSRFSPPGVDYYKYP
jgi:hypothetical protein